MSAEIWRWQGGTTAKDLIRGASVGPGGSYTLAGHTSGDWSGEHAGDNLPDWAAVNLDAEGVIQWIWQGGAIGREEFYAVATGTDGSAVMAGRAGDGTQDFAAVKLDEDGGFLWEWQEGSSAGDQFYAVVRTGDDSAVLAGSTFGLWGSDHAGSSDFTATKLDPDGTLVWTWQDGTEEAEEIYAAVVGDDDTVVLAGHTYGNWIEAQGGDDDADFAAVKLDADGSEVWRWQDGSTADDVLYAAAIGDDGSVVLAGSTGGSWDGAFAGGTSDFSAVKLDADGEEVWRWQGGTEEEDVIKGAAFGDDGSVVLAGYTEGSWGGSSDGSFDFAAVKLDESGVVVWRWQGSSDKSALDQAQAVVAGPDGVFLLAGDSRGYWDGENAGDYDFVALLLDADAVSTLSSSSELTSAVLTPAPVEPPTGLPSVNTLSPTLTPTGTPAAPTLTPGPPSPAPAVAAPPPSSAPLDTSRSYAPGDLTLAPFLEVPPSSAPASPAPTPTGLYAAPKTTSVPSSSAPALAGTRSPAPILPALGSTGPVSTEPDTTVSSTLAPSNRVPSTDSTTSSTQTSIPPTFSAAPSPAPTRAGLLTATTTTSAPSFGAPALAVATSLAPAPLALASSPAPILTGISSMAPTNRGGSSFPSTAPTSAAAAAAAAAALVSGSSSGISIFPGIVGIVFTAAAVVAVFAGLYVRRKYRKKQANDDKNDGDASAAKVKGPDEAAATNSAPSPDTESPVPAGQWDVAQAVLEAANHLALNSQFPGVSEAAMLVSTLVNLISNDRSRTAETEARLKRCHILVTMLQRAAAVLGKIGTIEDTDSSTGIKRMLVENVQDAIGNMVGLIKTYRSKRRLTQVVVSALFKRRMEEADAVIDHTFSDLMRWLHIDTALHREESRQDLVKDRRKANAMRRILNTSTDSATVGPRLPQIATENEAEAIVSARQRRRQRNLDQIEIPENQVLISEDILGKGGFGTVYLADYNGRNAAAKVFKLNQDHCALSASGDEDTKTELNRGESEATRRQRASLIQELQAMTRLRSPHTVNLYGAMTSRKDELIIVMELLTGGDLRNFLRHSTQKIPEAQARTIIQDVCAGMAFLHSKKAVHGDLKSANVLLDGEGRAKIGDFGTSRWAQNSDTTGLVTHATTQGSGMHMMSFAWAAPEVLGMKGSSYASDVYSFGIVAWEVLSMQVPWKDELTSLDIYKRVVFLGERPKMPADAPADIASVVQACWVGAPEGRPTSSEVMERLQSRELTVQ